MLQTPCFRRFFASFLVVICWHLFVTDAVVQAEGQLEEDNSRIPRKLSIYSFGGLEEIPVPAAVNLLKELGYGGLVFSGAEPLARFTSYLKLVNGNNSNNDNTTFHVSAALYNHKFKTNPLTDFPIQRKIIDQLSQRHGGGTIWCAFNDDRNDGKVTMKRVKQLIQKIFRYAKQRNVRMVLYPHYGNLFPTTDDALPIVKQINDPMFGTAISLNHERLARKGGVLNRTFANARDHNVMAIVLSGQSQDIDFSSDASRVASVNQPLDVSEYDLRPFMTLIRDLEYTGDVYFINFKITDPPENYLASSIKRWDDLCLEVELFEPVPPSLNPCLEQSFLTCASPTACPQPAPESFTAMLKGCRSKSNSPLFSCVQQSIMNVNAKCYGAVGMANNYFCNLVRQGYKKGKILIPACRAIKGRCSKIPNKYC